MRRLDIRTLTAAVAGLAALWAVTQGIGILRSDAARASASRAPADIATMDGLHQREEALSQALRARPMGSQNWASLAAVRNALAMTPGSVDGAFLMSALTGPNEAEVMAQRALLGLAIWDKASAGTRARALTDLCGLNVTDPSRLRLLLSARSESTRAEIRGGLVDHGCTGRAIACLGL